MIWMQAWLDEVTIGHTRPGIMKGDSRGAIALVKNTKDHGKVKHIDICHHYLCDIVKSGAISFEQIPSAEISLTYLLSHLPATTTIVSWRHSILANRSMFMGECWKVF